MRIKKWLSALLIVVLTMGIGSNLMAQKNLRYADTYPYQISSIGDHGDSVSLNIGAHAINIGNTVTVAGTSYVVSDISSSSITIPATLSAVATATVVNASINKGTVVKPNDVNSLWWTWNIDIGANRTLGDTLVDTDRIAMNTGTGVDSNYTSPLKLWEYMEPKVDAKTSGLLRYAVTDSGNNDISNTSGSTERPLSTIFADATFANTKALRLIYVKLTLRALSAAAHTYGQWRLRTTHSGSVYYGYVNVPATATANPVYDTIIAVPVEFTTSDTDLGFDNYVDNTASWTAVIVSGQYITNE